MPTSGGIGFLKCVFLSLLALPATVNAQAPIQVADLVIQHASIYTVDPQHPWAQAIAIKGERILFVGADDEIDHYVGPATKIVEAQGRLLLPGFIDSHLHVRLGGDSGVLQITDAGSLQAIQEQ